MFPALYDLSMSLSKRGATVKFLSSYKEIKVNNTRKSPHWIMLHLPKGWKKNVAFLRTSLDYIIANHIGDKPNWIIAQNDDIIPAIFYKLFFNWKFKTST